MELTGKSVLITGASSGIGLALSKKFSKENCKIALIARSIDKLQKLSSDYKTAQNIILPVYCDVSKKDNVNSAFDKVINELGGIDIAILNAGISERTSIENFSAETGEKIIRVNLTAKAYFIERLIPYFTNKRSGMIVGVSSLADTRGFPRSAFYNASKAGFTKLLESIKIELKSYGIKVITVRPGFVRTPMTDKNEFHMPLLMPPEKAAEIIIKGIKKEKKKIQFPFLTAMGAKVLEIIPDTLFELFAKKHLEGLKKKKL
jgi:short-subunit dehydrogenase